MLHVFVSNGWKFGINVACIGTPHLLMMYLHAERKQADE
jgi:hypothetical protein